LRALHRTVQRRHHSASDSLSLCIVTLDLHKLFLLTYLFIRTLNWVNFWFVYSEKYDRSFDPPNEQPSHWALPRTVVYIVLLLFYHITQWLNYSKVGGGLTLHFLPSLPSIPSLYIHPIPPFSSSFPSSPFGFPPLLPLRGRPLKSS